MFSAKKRGKCAFSAAFETDQKNFKTVKKKYLTPSIISCMITKVIAMEKILEQTLLYDFYGELLTEHQRQVYEDVVLNDFSLIWSDAATRHWKSMKKSFIWYNALYRSGKM